MAEARVAVLVPNLFLRASVDAAVRGANAVAVGVSSVAEARSSGCPVAVIDLDAAGEGGAELVGELAACGITVLGFGPHVDARRLAAARRAGAVVLPRGAFLAKLPELLGRALRP